MFETVERDLRGTKESITKQVPAEIDTEKNRGTRVTVYRFDIDGRIISHQWNIFGRCELCGCDFTRRENQSGICIGRRKVRRDKG